MKEKIFGAAIGAAVGFAASFAGPVAIGIGIGTIGTSVVHHIHDKRKAKKEVMSEQEIPHTEEANA